MESGSAMSYSALLQMAAPEAILALAALAVLAADLLGLRELEWRYRSRTLTILACTGCLVAIGWMVAAPPHASALEGMLVLDPLRRIVKVGLLALTVLTILLSNDEPITHYGEYLALVILAAI